MEIKIVLADSDVHALQHDILDIEAWVHAAIEGKVVACRARMIAEGSQILFADPATQTVPANVDDLVAAIIAHPQYKNRKARDAAAPKD